MNDNNSALGAVRGTLTAARDSLTEVRMKTPLNDIVRHGRAARRRHKLTGLAGAAAVMIGATLALITLAPSSHQPGRQASAQLTAWTVVKQSDGNVRVTIRELRNPAGLQTRLRADGVPASVTFIGDQNPACRPYPGAGTKSQRRRLLAGVYTFFPPRYKVMVIHPSALPAGAGVLISVQHHQPPHPGSFSITGGLVKARQHCTGS